MNAECYTTEFRQCLSPKGQLYLKADNQGKPDLNFTTTFTRPLLILHNAILRAYYTHNAAFTISIYMPFFNSSVMFIRIIIIVIIEELSLLACLLIATQI